MTTRGRPHGTPSERRRIALIRSGKRPRQNERLAGLLGETFPDHQIDDIDVFDIVRGRPGNYVVAAATGTVANLVPLARRRMRPKRAFVSSSGYARAARSIVAATVSPATHAFTFQSQSQFPIAVPGVPNFVYTDHTHLNNLDYPGFDRSNLANAGYLRRETEVYRSAATVFAWSNHVRDSLIDAYGCEPDRVAIVGTGPNAEPGPRDDGAWFGGRFVFVGMDWKRKGGQVLCDAFGLLREQHPECRLEIVGCRPPDVGGDGVTVHGVLSTAEVSELFAESDVFCLPTRAEPFGVAFIEAMHAGLPIIGSDLGAVPDLVSDGETGWAVPPDDPEALSRAMIDAVDRPAATREKGIRARALANERYRWDVTMASIAERVHAALDARDRIGSPEAVGATNAGGSAAHANPPRRRIALLHMGMRPDGGAEVLTRTLLDELEASRYEFDVISMKAIKDEWRADIESRGAGVVELPARRLLTPSRLLSLLRTLRRGRYDVIHTHLVTPTILGLLSGRVLRIPVVVTLHNTETKGDRHLFHGRLERFLIRRSAARVIAVGELTAEARGEILGDGVDIHVLPNAVSPSEPPTPDERDRVRAAIMSDPSAPLALAVGRLAPQKAHHNLIAAMRFVRDEIPGAELAIAGRGPLQSELEECIEAERLTGAVHLLGSRSDVRDLMHACDVFAMGSMWEGLPVAMLEAMEAGVPVVATRVGDVPAVLGDLGQMVEPDDVAALATAITKTLHDVAAGVDVSSRSRAIIEERYSSARWAQQICEHYEAVLAPRLGRIERRGGTT